MFVLTTAQIGPEILISIVSLCISFLSLLLNFVIYKRKNEKPIITYENARWVFGLQDKINKDEYVGNIRNPSKGLICFIIRIINTSDKDVGYFDFYLKHDKNMVDYYSPLQFNALTMTKNINIDTILLDPTNFAVEYPISLPSERGIIPANQETALAVVVNEDDFKTSVDVHFKLVRRAFFPFFHNEFESQNKRINLVTNKPDYEEWRDISSSYLTRINK